MQFTEAERKVEFGLELLGFSGYQLKLVDTNIWLFTADKCPTKATHLADDGKACYGCRYIHIPADRLDGYNNTDLARILNSVADWLGRSSQHNVRL